MRFIYASLILFISLYLCNGIIKGECVRKPFFVWQGVHNNGIIIQDVKVVVHVSSCERVCRFYSNCVGFNVNWTDSHEQTGICAILSSKANWIQSTASDVELAFYEKEYAGKNIALQIEGTSCLASNEPDFHECTNVMDGSLVSRWASSIKDDFQWIQLNLQSEYVIQRMDIYHSCKTSTQCNVMQFTLSQGMKTQISRQCNGHPTESACIIEAVPVEMYYFNMIRTNSVNIMCTKRCTENPVWVGYREVLIWAVKTK